SAGEPVDDVELPERAIAVEALHRDRLAEVEQVAALAAARRAHPAQVEVEIEVGIDLPARRRDRERVRRDALPQARDRVQRALGALAEPRAIGRLIEQPDADDR